ncbi:MAG: SDR family oxidoreductase [Candidatus Kariarchaeaceae archaeon]
MNKVIVVTGANGGIGRATAIHLSELGYSLILVDLDFDDDFREQLQDAVYLSVDISKREQVEKIVNIAQDKDWTISGLAHLAGITRDRSLLKMSDEEWNTVINVNLTGTFLVLQVVSATMKKEGGAIILTGSTAARHGNFGQLNYVATKAGVEGMTRTAARELAKYNIRVNCIVPGYISTAMTEAMPEETKESVIRQIPLNRPGKPSDVAKTIEFLLSERSNYITGESVKVDGGLRI